MKISVIRYTHNLFTPLAKYTPEDRCNKKKRKGSKYFGPIEAPKAEIASGLYFREHKKCDGAYIPTGYFDHKNFYRKKDKISISEYKKLSKIEKEKIKKNCNKLEIAAAKANAELGIILKNKLDKDYGKDNYVFISIGRSPALIARAMEFMGVEVKYLPISKLRGMSKYDIPMGFSGLEYFEGYKDYLREQNILGRDDDKKLLFYDYTFSRKSLKIFAKVMDKLFNICEPEASFKSLNDELAYLANIKRNTDIGSYIEDYLYHQSFLHSVFRPHLL